LTEWKRVLKPGGIMEIQVPDGEQIYKNYIANQREEREIRKGFEWVAEKIFGRIVVNKMWFGKDFWKYMHKTVFNGDSLRRALEKAGFQEIIIGTARSETSIEAKCIK